jgi:hypothetical protein
MYSVIRLLMLDGKIEPGVYSQAGGNANTN